MQKANFSPVGLVFEISSMKILVFFENFVGVGVSL
jgi:hypothetical protein